MIPRHLLTVYFETLVKFSNEINPIPLQAKHINKHFEGSVVKALLKFIHAKNADGFSKIRIIVRPM